MKPQTVRSSNNTIFNFIFVVFWFFPWVKQTKRSRSQTSWRLRFWIYFILFWPKNVIVKRHTQPIFIILWYLFPTPIFYGSKWLEIDYLFGIGNPSMGLVQPKFGPQMAILENFSIFSSDSENWENCLRPKFCERNAVKLGQKEVCSCFEGLKPSK